MVYQIERLKRVEPAMPALSARNIPGPPFAVYAAADAAGFQ